MSICVACHQPTGTGLPPVFPPLAKSEYVTGNPKRLAAIILKGVMGPITVEGTAYNSIMPAQEASLTDAKVAAIATYVRASFGNTGTPVSTEVAAAVRKEFAEKKTSWTEAELKNVDSSATVSPAASAPASGAPAPAAAQ